MKYFLIFILFFSIIKLSAPRDIGKICCKNLTTSDFENMNASNMYKYAYEMLVKENFKQAFRKTIFRTPQRI